MKVKVIRRFTDKYTKEPYSKGDMLDITEKRYAEIQSVGNFVFPIAQDNAESVSTDDMNTLSNDAVEAPTNGSAKHSDGFDEMSVAELKEYADKAYKMTFKGGTKKAEIIETLRRMENKEAKING